MTAADLSAARDRLRGTLPDTLHRALDAYDAVAARPVPEDDKAFAAWQGGCKAVLAHVELLLKLAARVGLDLSGPAPGAVDDGAALSALLARARAAVADGPTGPDGDHGGDHEGNEGEDDADD
ncbi:hypothetical protein [Roseospira goensis]|uniref:Uncharacterized protein n=1 Tax=Roseospira goensis TaxID=391922 RepID=A0A7W6RXN3_9PROT|nr:hypothetical protein [Roseospira goensis]MBB4285124.1 hypothetical protein [Roseospira goensis]